MPVLNKVIFFLQIRKALKKKRYHNAELSAVSSAASVYQDTSECVLVVVGPSVLRKGSIFKNVFVKVYV